MEKGTLMTDNHISAGKMVKLTDVDFEAVRKEIHDRHRLMCESGRDPYIWIDTTKAFGDGRNIYVNSECQSCMKGSDFTSVKDDPKLHIRAKITKRSPLK